MPRITTHINVAFIHQFVQYNGTVEVRCADTDDATQWDWGDLDVTGRLPLPGAERFPPPYIRDVAEEFYRRNNRHTDTMAYRMAARAAAIACHRLKFKRLRRRRRAAENAVFA